MSLFKGKGLHLLAFSIATFSCVANADNTLSFTGQLTEGTCELSSSDFNDPVDFGSLVIKDGDIETGGKQKTLHVTGCPGSVTQAGLKFDFAAGDATLPSTGMKNTGTAEGAEVFLFGPGGSNIEPGTTVQGNVENGSADFIITAALSHTTEMPALKAGSVISSATVTVTSQ